MDYTPNSDWVNFLHQYLDNKNKFKILDVIILYNQYQTTRKCMLVSLPVILNFCLYKHWEYPVHIVANMYRNRNNKMTPV